MLTSQYFKLLTIGAVFLVLTAWLRLPSSAGIADLSDSQSSGSMPRTPGSIIQTPSTADAPKGNAESGSRTNSTPSTMKSGEFRKLCMAQCKGPLFRCSQFCEYFNK
jgi:hypothetical protein